MCFGIGSLKHVGRRTVHKNGYIKIDRFHYKNRVPFNILYDFECRIKDGKHIPVACALFIKIDFTEIL